MFKKGEFVVNASHGICEVTDIIMSDMSGETKEYYVLVPMEEKATKIFLPVNVAENRIRPAMKKGNVCQFVSDGSSFWVKKAAASFTASTTAREEMVAPETASTSSFSERGGVWPMNC